MRPAHLALGFLALASLGLGLICLDAARPSASDLERRAATAALVAQLRLTDLALFTEARYSRHPSQADLHAPFQDHPLAFEHFPSGSLLPPPPALLSAYEALDRKTALSD